MTLPTTSTRANWKGKKKLDFCQKNQSQPVIMTKQIEKSESSCEFQEISSGEACDKGRRACEQSPGLRRSASKEAVAECNEEFQSFKRRELSAFGEFHLGFTPVRVDLARDSLLKLEIDDDKFMKNAFAKSLCSQFLESKDFVTPDRTQKL